MNIYAKENISTEQSSPRQETRLSRQNGDQERTRRFETPTREGTQSIDGQTLLNFRLPKASRLRKPREFRCVYERGKRFEGRFMTVFIAPSATAFQRLGITDSKKAVFAAFVPFYADLFGICAGSRREIRRDARNLARREAYITLSAFQQRRL